MRVAYSVQRGAEMASKPFVYCGTIGYRGVCGLVEYSQPRNKWVWGACVASGIWAHRMAEVYSPRFIADIIVAHTVSNWGNVIGTIYGAFIIAPGMIPTITPYVAYGAGALAGLATVLVINGLCLLILGKPPKENHVTETPESI